MRTDPSIRHQKETEEETDERIRSITRKVAIAFVLLIQLAIFFKMLI